MHSMKILAAVLAVGASGTLPAEAATRSTPTKTTIARGGYFNDLACIPRSAPAGPALDDLECTGGSLYNGDLTVHTIIHFRAHLDPATLRFTGSYDELLIGTYVGDHTHGALHTLGTFSIDENGAFHASARITSGTCDWAGSTGSITYEGYQTNGGYISEWIRPKRHPAVAASCNPLDRVPGVATPKARPSGPYF